MTRPADRVRLKELLVANHAPFTVNVLNDDLRQLWGHRYLKAASQFWQQRYPRAMASCIGSLQAFACSRAVHLDGILGHCHYPLHTSFLEGINNEIKVIKRLAYGFRDDAYFFVMMRSAFPGFP